MAELDLATITARNGRFEFLAPGGALVVDRVELKGREDLDALAGLVGTDVPALVAAVKDVRDLHAEFKIYDDCGHHHEPGDGVVDIEEVGLVCKDGYLYSICRECCTDGGQEYQTETCAAEHDTSRNCWPCTTRRAVDGGATS
jgi:hypothetical protein